MSEVGREQFALRIAIECFEETICDFRRDRDFMGLELQRFHLCSVAVRFTLHLETIRRGSAPGGAKNADDLERRRIVA